jgi:hypothetical protein
MCTRVLLRWNSWKYILVEVSGHNLEISSFLPFYKNMNKIAFSSMFDCFVWISETKGVVWFSVGKSLKTVVPITYKNTFSVKSCKVCINAAYQWKCTMYIHNLCVICVHTCINWAMYELNNISKHQQSSTNFFVCQGRRKIRLIECIAKCRYLKNLSVKGLCGRCFSCLRPPPPLWPHTPPPYALFTCIQ